MTTGPPAIDDVLALSPLQEGLFALHRLAEAGIDRYSMQFVVDIDGPVDAGLLRRSAAALLVRHPNLRAAFWDRDVPRPVQIIPAEAELPWVEQVAAATEFDAIAAAERHRPFDLSRGPALRVALVAVPGAARRRMIFTAHHILVDGWSLAVFFTELLAVYRAGGSPGGLPAARPYRDYIVWLAGQDRAAALATWRDYLRRVSGPLMLADGAALGGDNAPATTELLLSAADAARLRQWAGGAGLTLSTAVLFAWSVVLSRISDRRDVVFGTVVSGRPEQLAGVDSMVGLFINTVPVVHQLSRTEAAVQQCRQLQRELSTMRDIGYFSLAELQRADGRGALFDTLFVFENAPIDQAIHPVTAPDGTRFTPVEMESLTHYPLTVVSHLRADALVVAVEVNPAALPHLPADLGERLLAVLRQLPDIGERTPEVLTIRTAAEQAESHPSTEPAPPAGTVWEVFERQARATPDAEALTAGSGEQYSYAELHSAATRLAQELTVHGVAPETVVALVLPRSPRSLIAILAVLAAGGAYLPVDTTLPQPRVTALLRRADPVLTVTDSASLGLCDPGLPTVVLDDTAVAERICGHPAVAPTVRRRPEHAAYVIFTSGSTGEPKGVIGTNAALLSYFADHRDRIYRPAVARLGRPLRIAHAWSLSFDASWQPMVGLLDGHGLHLFGADEMRDADRMVRGIAAQRIDMIDTTPSMFTQLRAAGLLDHPLSVLALGGEAIDTALWDQLRVLSPTPVYNCYGPTEATVEAVVAQVGRYPAPTIGTPNTGTAAYVLDSALRMVPDGVAGELYLSGAQLARGYLGQPALTAARFVADPQRPGRCMYRTGDLVRRLPHGGYAYLGRADSQVKIRGYRVETSEIEAALRGLPGVVGAAVAVLRGDTGTRLVGFVVAPGEPVDLRTALTGVLPSYMVPARILALPRLPVNANGKLDGHALDRLAEDALCVSGDGLASASTDTERVLCEVFAEQFNSAPPHVDDDLFALGLDSIVAISVVHKTRRRGLAASPRMVFAAGTIRQLAASIDSAGSCTGVVADADYGPVLPLPMVSWLYEYGSYRRFTHTVLVRLSADIDRPAIESMLQLLLDSHDTLRSILTDTPDGPRLVTRAPGAVCAADLLTHESGRDITGCARRANDAIDPRAGAMLRAVWLTGGAEQILLLTAHHLAVDVVSWHIMLGDVAAAWQSRQSGATPKVLPEFTSYRRWSELMWQRASTPQVRAQLGHWAAQLRDPDPALGSRHPDPGRDTWSTLRVTAVRTPVEATHQILTGLRGGQGIREFLLTATAMTVAGWRRLRGQDPATGTLVSLEGHGRADALLGTDTTSTVGWFTTAFPIRLGAAGCDVVQGETDPGAARALLDSVCTELAAIPDEGLDYGLLRYVENIPELAVDPQIQFGYLGRLDLSGVGDQPWSLFTGGHLDALPIDPEPDLPLRFALNISALVGATEQGVQLITTLRWSSALFTGADIDRLAELWARSIAALSAGLT
ncbi:MAG TPA: amino acid adenylation domain-containing protein [Mycobacterium sp.]|nr:amino acid adenylation domain-containing protein [Mycobacterium sp.]